MASLRPTHHRQDTDISLQPVGDGKEPGIATNGNSTYRDQDKDYSSEEKSHGFITEAESDLPAYNPELDNHFGEADVLTDAKDIVTHVLHVEDDPTLSPWTFRMWFLGMLSCLGHQSQS